MRLRAVFRTLTAWITGLSLGKRYLIGSVLLWVGLCFVLGYRLPWFDRHPDWPEFPRMSNPRLVVEYIPDSVFERCYARRFPQVLARQEDQQYDFSDTYRTNLRNLRSLGSRVTDNDFTTGYSINTSFGGGNDPGRQSTPTSLARFDNDGYEYVELRLGQETTNFKHRLPTTGSSLQWFYQYNLPRHSRDTLYLRYFDTDYRIMYR
jgi:hypothetical protein